MRYRPHPKPAVRISVGLSALLVSTFTLGVGVVTASVQATTTQDADDHPTRTVWDGVYTVDQADRGGRAYRDVCSYCHDTGEAPELVGEAFMRTWFQDALSVPFSRIRETMPLDDAGSLPDEVYLEILTYLLEASGVPAGEEPLSASEEELARILVVDESGLGGPVPNFSLVQVVGCLNQDADGVWHVTQASEPVRTRDPSPSPLADTGELLAGDPGAAVFQLLEPLPRVDLDGHTVLAKGFLVRQPDGDRLNPTALQTLADRCPAR